MQNDKQFVPTGVPRLDLVLMGGFLREGFYLVQGDPGSGKTTLALQFVLGRKAAGERCLYISLTESRRDLDSACRSQGWSLEGVEVCDLSRSAANLAGEPESSVFHPSETELGETTQAVLAAVEKVKPQHVVFDGLSEMRLLSGNALVYRRQLLALKEFFAARQATVLLLDDRSSAFGDGQPESLESGDCTRPKCGARTSARATTTTRLSREAPSFTPVCNGHLVKPVDLPELEKLLVESRGGGR